MSNICIYAYEYQVMLYMYINSYEDAVQIEFRLSFTICAYIYVYRFVMYVYACMVCVATLTLNHNQMTSMQKFGFLYLDVTSNGAYSSINKKIYYNSKKYLLLNP